MIQGVSASRSLGNCMDSMSPTLGENSIEKGFLNVSMGKESVCKVGDRIHSFDPWAGKIP